MKRRLINTHPDPCAIVKDIKMYRYEVRCWCGELWRFTTTISRCTREIVDYMAEEGWSLDDDDHPRCTKCLRKVKEGLLPKDPDNLGKTQKGVLQSLRQHGSWGRGCGWLWDTHSNTKKVLDTLVKRDLVEINDGVYTPK